MNIDNDHYYLGRACSDLNAKSGSVRLDKQACPPGYIWVKNPEVKGNGYCRRSSANGISDIKLSKKNVQNIAKTAALSLGGLAATGVALTGAATVANEQARGEFSAGLEEAQRDLDKARQAFNIGTPGGREKGEGLVARAGLSTAVGTKRAVEAAARGVKEAGDETIKTINEVSQTGSEVIETVGQGIDKTLAIVNTTATSAGVRILQAGKNLLQGKFKEAEEDIELTKTMIGVGTEEAKKQIEQARQKKEKLLKKAAEQVKKGSEKVKDKLTGKAIKPIALLPPTSGEAFYPTPYSKK